MDEELAFIRKSAKFLALFLIILIIARCAAMYTQRLDREIKSISQASELNKKSPCLKVHMLNGQVYILSKWNVNEESESVSGKGRLLDFNRKLVDEGDFSISLEEVAIFETNVLKVSPAIAAMTILTVSSLILTTVCLINPKACFGSCPTFYAWDGEKNTLQAEGFSASVCPVLEAQDIDALYRAKPKSQNLEIRVTNEALETHVIRQTNILAAPRPRRGRTFVSLDGEFWQASRIQEPNKCIAREGECLAKVRTYDGIERFSRVDGQNLATRETIDLEFSPVSNGKLGLILGFRQTLLTTYLFYQGLAYMGNSTGYWFAKLQRGDERVAKYSRSIGETLGGIEVFAQARDNHWVLVGETNETGPIASDVRMILLPEMESTPIKIRLRMTRGLWRLDYIALAELNQTVEPIRLAPDAVFREGRLDNEAKKSLTEQDSVLVTMPGDEFTLVYQLPTDYQHYELFLESQGYYLEWMRPSWIKEENLPKTIMMFKNPEEFLKAVAPEFKKVEPQMEDLFWRSKYVRK